MRTILPLALLAVTACYTPRAVDPAPNVYDRADAYGMAPLEASVFYHEYSGYVSFDVSRPAHVALFALRPGGGMNMIYPARGIGGSMTRGGLVGEGRSQFYAGRHSVRTLASPYRMTGNWSMAYGEGPMYILLVASDEPLDVSPFRATGTLAWLNRSAITYNPYVALDALVGEIVPRPNTSAWTTAVHMVWPMSSFPGKTERRYVAVQCRNGLVVYAPIEAVLANYPICPEHLQQQPLPVDSAKAKERIADVTPRPGNPPAGWMSTRIGDVDLNSELKRMREENGKRDPGILEIRPFPAFPPAERSRTLGPARSGDNDRVGIPASRDRTRTETSRSAPSRTEARPARPVKPTPTPAARPAPPPRPSPPAKPKPKPKTGSGSGEG